jgi:DUF4097 and DUF4098 domain-containing protein YvlB
MIVKLNAVMIGTMALLTTTGGAAVCGAQRPDTSRDTEHQWMFDSERGLTKIDSMIPFTSSGTVELRIGSGTINVKTWDRNDGHVVASTSNNTKLDLDVSRSHIGLNTRGRWTGRMPLGTANYDVTVPVGTRLSLNAMSGSLKAAGVRGRIDANAISGSVDVRDASGNVEAQCISGPVTIAGVSGDVRVETVSGAIDISNVSGAVRAENVSGSIDVTNARGPRVRLGSMSGSLSYAGVLSPDGRYEFETHSGTVALHLPSNSNADVAVETFSG